MQVNYEELVDLISKDNSQEYKIVEVYQSLLCRKVSKETGVWVISDRGDFTIESTNERLSSNNVTGYSDLLTWVESKVGGDKDSIKIKDYFSYRISELALSGKPNQLKTWGTTYDSQLPYLIFFGVSGDIDLTKKFNVNSEELQKYANDNPGDETTYFYPTSNYMRFQIRYGQWIDLSQIDRIFKGITLKLYANGRIDIKGLSTKEWENIEKVFEICKKR